MNQRDVLVDFAAANGSATTAATAVRSSAGALASEFIA
jgi:hypothetical protein